MKEELHKIVNRKNFKSRASMCEEFGNSNRAGLSKIVAKYEPVIESGVGLSEELSGFAIITDTDIQNSIESCMKEAVVFQGKDLNTMGVLMNSKIILDRISEGVFLDVQVFNYIVQS